METAAEFADKLAMDGATTLEPLTDGVWTVISPLSILGMPIGHRMTVVRLGGGGLWLHSPVPWSSELESRLEAIGPVEHWVAPSRTHDLYLDQWFENAPRAATWGAPKLRKPHPEWTFTAWLSEGLDAPWREEIDLVPLEGAPRVGEWMFLHRPSKTAITADAIFNLGTGARGFGRMMMRIAGTYGRAGRSRLMRLAVRDEQAWKSSLRRVLEWDFDKLVVGHGTPITDDPKGCLAKAWEL